MTRLLTLDTFTIDSDSIGTLMVTTVGAASGVNIYTAIPARSDAQPVVLSLIAEIGRMQAWIVDLGVKQLAYDAMAPVCAAALICLVNQRALEAGLAIDRTAIDQDIEVFRTAVEAYEKTVKKPIDSSINMK